MILNPDKEHRKKILLELKDTGGYCPCLIEQSEDTICPCIYKRNDEQCICGLYVNIEKVSD